MNGCARGCSAGGGGGFRVASEGVRLQWPMHSPNDVSVL